MKLSLDLQNLLDYLRSILKTICKTSRRVIS